MKSAILTCKYLNVKSIIVAVPCSATDCIEDIIIFGGKQSIKIELDSQHFLYGDLTLVPNSIGLVLFAHGSGSSRLSPRNQYVAEQLNESQISTFLLDLLTKNEEIEDDRTRKLRFNIPFLADRLSQVTDWLYQNNKNIQNLSIGYFGASTGGAAAIIAGGIKQQKRTKAIVS
ncbi:unnamed protein product, partial [Rotaria sp. Silwood1]